MNTSHTPILAGIGTETIHDVAHLMVTGVGGDKIVDQVIDTTRDGVHFGAHVLHYGSGGIEGMRSTTCVDGRNRIIFPREHYSRLIGTAIAADALDEDDLIVLPDGSKSHRLLDWSTFSSALLEVAAQNHPKVKPGVPLYMRPWIAEASCRLGVDSTEGTLFALMSRDMDPYLGEQANTGVTLWAPGPSMFCRADPRCGAADHKTVINYMLGKKYKRIGKKRFHVNDVLQFGLDGLVKECTGQNIFLRIGSTWYAPGLDGSLLPGINRRRAITILRALGLNVVECQVTVQMLYRADEIFLTGTWTGIVPVRTIIFGPIDPQVIRAPFHDKDPGNASKEVRRIHTALTTFDLDAIPHQMEINSNWWLEVP